MTTKQNKNKKLNYNPESCRIDTVESMNERVFSTNLNHDKSCDVMNRSFDSVDRELSVMISCLVHRSRMKESMKGNSKVPHLCLQERRTRSGGSHLQRQSRWNTRQARRTNKGHEFDGP
eukprot:TRINITY_DN4921_c0_g1_i5.p1 TRINITY_DN4921_c0_g1~~TRINITY_DN4921_c0_g1_i5.p1  ORF type:complete len:119 (+),score=10.43 TRINITY_DN4921_c0_g1_i5:496-852(+)